jgi:hypothetical protein
MGNMDEPFANSLGTANLLIHLEDLKASLERYNSDPSCPEPEAVDLIVQVKDFVAAATSLDSLATQERRSPSAHRKSLSAADLVHMRSVCSCVATLSQDCVGFLESLQAQLKQLTATSERIGYIATEDQLGTQSWYRDALEGLKLRTEVVRVAFSAINLLQHKNDTDGDGSVSEEVQSFASTLQYQIALVNPKLNATSDGGMAAVCHTPCGALKVSLTMS